MYTHILIPTDGSKLSERAVEAGVRLARALGARVTGLFVAPPATPVVFKRFVPVGYVPPDEHAEMIERAAARYLGVIERAAKAAQVPCTVLKVTSDFPADTIVQVAKQRRCDLICMASHGRGGLSALILGSEARKVLTNSPVPVLVHREAPAGGGGARGRRAGGAARSG
jgi:nucleotide-binding universal stress UspA family protein